MSRNMEKQELIAQVSQYNPTNLSNQPSSSYPQQQHYQVELILSNKQQPNQQYQQPPYSQPPYSQQQPPQNYPPQNPQNQPPYGYSQQPPYGGYPNYRPQ